MEKIENLLRDQIDESTLSFIREYIFSLDELEILRFFGLNPGVRVDIENLLDVTFINREDMRKTLKMLVDTHILEETELEGKKYYELSRDTRVLELLNRLYCYYKNDTIRRLIIDYVMQKNMAA